MITNSFSAMNWAKSLPLKRAPKVILTALISYIDLNTGRCTLSIAKIEKDWPYKARSIRKAFADLESLGLIEREFSSGVATTYRVCFDAQMPLSNESNTPANFARRPRQTLHVTPANFARRPRQTLQGHINYNNYSINTPLLSPKGKSIMGRKQRKPNPQTCSPIPLLSNLRVSQKQRRPSRSSNASLSRTSMNFGQPILARRGKAQRGKLSRKPGGRSASVSSFGASLPGRSRKSFLIGEISGHTPRPGSTTSAGWMNPSGTC
ncbi:hypothetical protein DOFOFD_05915 [Acetobacteraceae bacterium EV16P]|uniref:Helix-turn-helix domain-containing protein n=1 Tax=Sorlinia euscelidii TaxID=3081148 RepID=A0ABU7U2S5_9PROT